MVERATFTSLLLPVSVAAGVLLVQSNAGAPGGKLANARVRRHLANRSDLAGRGRDRPAAAGDSRVRCAARCEWAFHCSGFLAVALPGPEGPFRPAICAEFDDQ